MTLPGAKQPHGVAAVYVYYRLPAADVVSAAAAVHRAQQRLCERHAGLRTRLLRRPDLSPDGACTLMETYEMAGGINTGLQETIAAELEAALQPWSAPTARHVEIFEDLPCAS